MIWRKSHAIMAGSVATCCASVNIGVCGWCERSNANASHHQCGECGDYLVIGTTSSLNVYKCSREASVPWYTIQCQSPVCDVAVSSNARWFACVSSEYIRLWDPYDLTFVLHHPPSTVWVTSMRNPRSAVFSVDGSMLFIGTDCDVYICHTYEKIYRILRQPRRDPRVTLKCFTTKKHYIHVSTSGVVMLADLTTIQQDMADSMVIGMDLSNPVAYWTHPDPSTTDITDCSMHPHGMSIAIGTKNQIDIINLDSRAIIQTIKYDLHVKQCSFSPCGNHMAVFTGHRLTCGSIVDLASQICIASIPESSECVAGHCWVSDGTLAMATKSGDVRLLGVVVVKVNILILILCGYRSYRQHGRFRGLPGELWDAMGDYFGIQ